MNKARIALERDYQNYQGQLATKLDAVDRSEIRIKEELGHTINLLYELRAKINRTEGAIQDIYDQIKALAKNAGVVLEIGPRWTTRSVKNEK